MARQETNIRAIKKPKPDFKGEFDKLKKLFFSPKAFFERVAMETEYLQPLLYFIIILVIAQFVNVLLSIPATLQQPMGALAVVFSFFGIAVGAAIGFVIPFISSGINHLGVLMFGGKKGYYNTFKPTTYSMVIGIIYGLIISIINFILVIINPITMPEAPPASFAELMAVIPISYLVVNGLLYAISMVHTICTQVTGISRFQGMSKIRAFLAVFVMMLIMTLVIVLVVALALKIILALSPAPA